jgi:nucleoid DNA-binding protein
MSAQKLSAEQLVAKLAFDAATTKENVRNVLDALNRVTREALVTGQSVTIPGLVRLAPKERAARPGRNPRTGESFPIPARRVVAASVMPSLTIPQD